jgi:hypothetical protein
MGTEELGVDGAILNVAVARSPSLMMFAFNPNTTHVVEPAMLAQLALLPAAVALEPADTLTLAMDAG